MWKDLCRLDRLTGQPMSDPYNCWSGQVLAPVHVYASRPKFNRGTSVELNGRLDPLK